MAFQTDNDAGQADEHSDLAEINIIPLVDVMLVLLIIFMVAAPLSITGIKIELPKSQAKGTNLDEDRIVLTIDKDGEYFMEKARILKQDLPGKLKAIYEFREKKDIYIRADQNVKYKSVIDAMSAAKLAGVSRMAMLTEPPGKSG